jgi:hypothetical protein
MNTTSDTIPIKSPAALTTGALSNSVSNASNATPVPTERQSLEPEKRDPEAESLAAKIADVRHLGHHDDSVTARSYVDKPVPLVLDEIVISTFANAEEKRPRGRLLVDVLEEIRNGKYRTAIEKIRGVVAEGDKAKAKKLKRALPGFPAAGQFSGRSNDTLISRSGLIVADIDGLSPSQIDDVALTLDCDPHAVAGFVSPSGNGVKILYRVDINRSHAEAFSDMRAHVRNFHRVDVDEACKDVSRLCFVSYDPQLFVNPSAGPLPPFKPDESTATADETDDLDLLSARIGKPDKATVAALLECIPSRPDYPEWIKIIAAVCDALDTEDACNLLCEWSPEEESGEYRAKCAKGLGRVTTGTLYHLAAQHDPERVAQIKARTRAKDWFPAEIWGYDFAEKWNAALSTKHGATLPTMAAQLLSGETKRLLLNLDFSNPAILEGVRKGLAEIAADPDADSFARSDIQKTARELAGVSCKAFNSAVKQIEETHKRRRIDEALREIDGETGPCPLYFDGAAYWRREHDGAFGKLTRNDAQLHLNMTGLTKVGDPSPCDSALHELQMKNRISYAGPLCGRPAGVHIENGIRVLATREPKFIEGKPGNWDTIDRVISNLLGKTAGDAHAEKQRMIFFAWLKLGREALRNPKDHLPGQVLALVGPPDCGKSFLQSAVITPALGGRVADPGLAFTGQSTFNSDLWEAEHLALGDKALDVDGRQRAALRNELKRAVAEPSYPLHAKHRDALAFRQIWRITLSANDDPESASHLPTLTGGFGDKIVYLKCFAPPAPFFDVNKSDDRKQFADDIASELPAFLSFIDSFVIPPAMRKGRFGLVEYHHPAILDLLGMGDPLQAFEEVLESWIESWPEGEESRQISTSDLFAALDTSIVGGMQRQKLCSGVSHLGHMLGKLADKIEWSDRLKKTTKREGGRTANRAKACWEIQRESLM